MDEKTKLLLDWLIKMGVVHLDVTSETLYQEFLDNNKEQLNQIKNLGESSSRLSAVSGCDSGWIACNDKMPKHDHEASGDVVAGIIEDNKVIRWGRANVGNNGSWYREGLCLTWKPTHWFPIPKPQNHCR